MKNIVFKSYCFLSILMLSSCTDDFLTIEPETRVSTETFWTTQADAELGVNGCYDSLQPDSYYGFDMFVLGDVRSDNCFAGGDNPSNFEINEFNVRATNGIVTRFWQQLYRAIGRTNIAISRISGMDETLFTNGKKQALLGEAYFLRGLHYFYLVQLFGDVPLPLTATEDIAPELIFIPRQKEQVVYNQIVKDLRTAITFLEGKDQDPGRATVAAAEGILAKVQLTQKRYDEVIRLTTSLQTRGFGLLDNYDELFDQKNKFNNEVLFAVRYSNGQEDGNVFPELILPPPYASFEFTKFNTPTPDSQQVFTNNDLRRESAIKEQDESMYVFKWRNGSAFDSDDYTIVLRYADVLLMRAEALNFTNATEDAITIINRIRKRAGLDDYKGVMSREAVDKAILEERRVELLYEGHRWFDLKRKGFTVAREALEKGKGLLIEKFEMLLPIPQVERDKNELLTQNPGY